MIEIPLTKGYVAYVSDEDCERVSQFRWCAYEQHRKDGSIRVVYAQRGVRKEDGSNTTQALHRFIMGVTDSKVQIDHHDHNGLNNQRDNLRVATRTQNQGNRRRKQSGTSQFKGVSWNKVSRKWLAQTRINGKKIYLGLFDSEFDAALEYDKTARQTFGEFAKTNFPLESLAVAA
jgi:hypothetical protein